MKNKSNKTVSLIVALVSLLLVGLFVVFYLMITGRINLNEVPSFGYKEEIINPIPEEENTTLESDIQDDLLKVQLELPYRVQENEYYCVPASLQMVFIIRIFR